MNAVGQETSAPADQQAPPRDTWWRTRWIIGVTLVFVAHVGLIFAFGNRKPVEPRAVENALVLHVSTGRSELQTLDDPTLFALPHSRGFAAGSWLRLPPVEFAPFRWTEPPQLLRLPVERLGKAFLRYAETNAIPRLELNLRSPPELTVLPATEAVTALKQHSEVRVSGGLINRRWLNAPAILRSWPAADLLTNSLVQILTDADGQVLSAAVMPPGSGSKAADQRALELARSAHFAPAGGNQKNLLVGTLIFEWHTLPLPETNAPPAIP